MNDKITLSTFQIFQKFPDQESARIYLESRLWPKGVNYIIPKIKIKGGLNMNFKHFRIETTKAKRTCHNCKAKILN